MCQSPKKRERDRHKNIDAQPQRQRPVYTVTVDSNTQSQLQSENISNVLDVNSSKSNCVMNVECYPQEPRVCFTLVSEYTINS